MNWLTEFFQSLPIYLLSLPVILMALSVHESAHGYVAYKLGDPTARNLGRLTLNPIKHIDPIGFLCMLLFHFGWAKPVPINTRYFKKPRRDMALSGAAGPVSNLLLAALHLIVLRVTLIFVCDAFFDETLSYAYAVTYGYAFEGSLGFTAVSIILLLLDLGVVMNLGLALFNLIPVPPFDGSRIFYAFLPPKWYFGIMKYEQIILIVFYVLFFLVLGDYFSMFLGWLEQGLYTLTGVYDSSPTTLNSTTDVFVWMRDYVYNLLSF